MGGGGTLGGYAIYRRQRSGVQHGKKADGGAEVSGIGGDGEQSFGSGLKQNSVNLSRVLKRQATDLLRKSEDDVEVRNGQ